MNSFKDDLLKKYAWDNDCISQLLVAQKLISLLTSILNIEKTHSGSFFWGQLLEDFWYASMNTLFMIIKKVVKIHDR